MSTEVKNTMRSASIIGATALLGAGVGFILQLLVAFYFGASRDTDAYFMALSTSELLSKLLMGGSLTAVFIPLLVQKIAAGKRDEAWYQALNVSHITTALFIFLSVVLAVSAESFIHIIAPGFDNETTLRTANLLRILLPSFIALFIVDMITAIFHAFKQFSFPAWLRVIAPLSSLITLIITASWLGIYALALGAVLGSVLQLAFLWWGLTRQGFAYRFVFKPTDPVIKQVWYLLYPFIISMLTTQAAGIAYRVLVSGLSEGSLASLKFAEKITQMITIIFLNSVTMVIYPGLAEKAVRGDFRGIHTTLASAIRLVAVTTVPIVIGIAQLRHPLVSLVYGRGSFGPDDIAQTSSALLFLSIGLTTNGISSILGNTTMALQKTRAAVAVTAASQIVAIALFAALVPFMQHAGLALASSLVPLSSGLLYYLYLRRYIPNLRSAIFQPQLLKIIVLGAIVSVVLWLLLHATENYLATDTQGMAIRLIIGAIFGGTIFFGGAYLWRINELEEVRRVLARKLGLNAQIN